jgi:formylglycine-generating enzyme required for sulfatase activity
MRKFLIPLRLEHFFRFKLFIHFAMSIVFFCFAQKALASNSCNAIYSVQRSNAEIMALLDPKFQTSLRSLAELHLSIELMKQKNPDSIVAVSLNDAYQKKYQQHLEYFRKNEIMNENEMIFIMKGYILEKQGRLNRDKELENERKKIEREQVINNSIIDGTRAVLLRIEPGSFKMGKVTLDDKGVVDRSNQVDVTITKPFDMMATPTTQIIWSKIADLATQRFQGKYQINADPSHFKGDLHPVEKVSYNDVQTWLMALNELSAAGEAVLTYLIPGHKKGDVYRLPTDAEWEFVVRGRGQYNDIYHFGNQEVLLGEYAWHAFNSWWTTHPVAQKKPLIIDGKQFYDMHGNVWEWVHDLYQETLPGGTDPQGPTIGIKHVVRGSAWGNNAQVLHSGDRGTSEPGFRGYILGFRFVRTRQ